jgi:Zn-dependent protease
MEWLYSASAWVIPVVLAITLHEVAHGWMALRFGDDTAKRLGRLTFNPLKHIDRTGTIVLPALLMLAHSPVMFGYAKPVPVDFSRLTPPRLGMFMVAIAGVCVNFLQALFAGLSLHLEAWVTPEQAPWLFLNLYRVLMINCVLIVFNLIPILPLDGGRVVDSFLTGAPKRLFVRFERYGMALILLLLLLPPFLGYNLMGDVIGGPAYWLIERVLWLTGNGQPDSSFS